MVAHHCVNQYYSKGVFLFVWLLGFFAKNVEYPADKKTPCSPLGHPSGQVPDWQDECIYWKNHTKKIKTFLSISTDNVNQEFFSFTDALPSGQPVCRCNAVFLGASREHCYISLYHSSRCSLQEAPAADSGGMWRNHWSGQYPVPLWSQR